MNHEATLERESRERRGARFSDQLTMSSRFIAHAAQHEYRPESIIVDWPIGTAPARCGWLSFVVKQLAAIAELPDGWDSYGVPAPDPRLVSAARGLISCIALASDLPQPHVNPTRAGGVQFEWESGARYFEVEIVGERSAEYLYCDEAAGVEETGSVRQQESLDDVLDRIRRVGTSHNGLDRQ